MKTIITESLSKSFSYITYRSKVSESLLDKHADENDEFFKYFKLNDQRMKRLDKTVEILPEHVSFLKELNKKIYLLVLSEGWCGDAAQALPVLNKMAEISDSIELKIVFRDENEELMNCFLTNGGKSIPKVLFVNPETLEVIADWGPRPQEAVSLIDNLKAKFGGITDEVKEELQKWYNSDKTISTQNEIIALIKNSVL